MSNSGNHIIWLGANKWTITTIPFHLYEWIQFILAAPSFILNCHACKFELMLTLHHYQHACACECENCTLPVSSPLSLMSPAPYSACITHLRQDERTKSKYTKNTDGRYLQTWHFPEVLDWVLRICISLARYEDKYSNWNYDASIFSLSFIIIFLIYWILQTSG